MAEDHREAAAGGAQAEESLKLVSFSFWLTAEEARDSDHTPETAAAAAPAPRLDHLQHAMVRHLQQRGWAGAEPLRWAITAVDARHGWRLEGVALQAEEGSRPTTAPVVMTPKPSR